MAKFIYRLRHGRAISRLWFEGWFNSPRMKAKTERFMVNLERQHAFLTKALG